MIAGESVRYEPITAGDAEVFRTVALLVRMKDKHDAFRGMLTQAYEQDQDNAHTALAYGLFHLLAYDRDVLEMKANVEKALAAFEAMLERNPQNWIARMYRIRILLLLPNNYRDEDELIDELRDMIASQEQNGYQPYFVIPYLLLAETCLAIAEAEKAQEAIAQAELLEKQPIRQIPDFLIQIFNSLEKKLRISSDLDTASRVKRLKSDFFEQTI